MRAKMERNLKCEEEFILHQVGDISARSSLHREDLSRYYITYLASLLLQSAWDGLPYPGAWKVPSSIRGSAVYSDVRA